ncbi:hypothetical protein OIU77_014993 [Salix suchowensis]|uniref:Pentatricopeptide repeat-containing protein n=1 Tax=Salix suchowensis TaxID=1278906 RepID=A0ABQ8ZZK8_9ROSI|nr:hypothetical protein OIU77_014993 [Salix suchowensis]
MHSIIFQITSKITALARSGYITHARKLFDEMPKRDTVAWNSMLTGYSHLGLHQEALSLFQQMRTSNTKPDHFTFTTTLNACGASSSFLNGTKIHALVIALGCQSSIPVNNSLIDMYGKCLSPFSANKVFQEMNDSNEVSWGSLLFAYTNSGQFDAAASVFKFMPKKVGVAWNIMISGLGQYGEIELCLEMFKEMRESFREPDQYTYSALISACAESLEIGVFESMGTLTQVSWNAIIDVYMKAGDTSEAFLSFQRMPDKNVVSWTSMITGYARNWHSKTGDVTSSCEPLLGACSTHSEVETGTNVGATLIDLEPRKETSYYVLLSNLYCTRGRWKEAEMVRKAMVDEGLKKIPGCSWIEVGNKCSKKNALLTHGLPCGFLSCEINQAHVDVRVESGFCLGLVEALLFSLVI